VVDGLLFFFAALFLEPERNPFSARVIVFDLQVHDGADPGERVGQHPEQGAVAEACVRGSFDRVKKLLDFTIDKCRRFCLRSVKTSLS
jgi:hypothetical protein